MSSSLSTEARAQLEDHFQADLSTVRVHTGEEACRLNSRLGTWAVTLGEDIFVLKPLYAPDHLWGKFLLAHEVAHVLQKRLHRISPHRQADSKGRLLSRLEQEANDAARSLILGKRCNALSPDSDNCGRAFGPVGHYYTVYFVCLAAGLSPSAASELAYYAQIADQISEIDATAVIKEWSATYWKKMQEDSEPWLGQHIKGHTPKRSHLDAWLKRYVERDTILMMQCPADFVAIVQRGLHCLTGGLSFDEASYRSKRLEAGNIGEPVSYGLAIHAFGDSFAHRVRGDERHLYLTGAGHAVEALQTPFGSLYEYWGTGDVTVAHCVDNISFRKELYEQYGISLYRILCKKVSLQPRKSEHDVKKTLVVASAHENEARQRDVLTSEMRRMVGDGRLSIFDADGQAKAWRPDLYKIGPLDFGCKKLLNALYHAATWARWRPIGSRVDRWVAEELDPLSQRLQEFERKWRLVKETLEIAARRVEARELAVRAAATRQVRDKEKHLLELARKLAAMQSQIQDGVLDEMVALNTITEKLAATRFPDPKLNMQVRNLIQCADGRKRYVANVYSELLKRRPYLDKNLEQAAPGWRNWCD
jgi:uncharacterized protein DUF4157/uncharacterized protein DUF6765